jgi:hypothetical protein
MQWVRSRHFWRDNGSDSGNVIENEINEVVGRVSEFEKGRGRVWWQVFSPGLGGKDMWIERMLLGVKGNEWL